MPRGINPLDTSRIQGREWTPEVLRPFAWWDAADLTTIDISTGVSEWRNKGTGVVARSLAQATAANQPALTLNVLNGLPVVAFDGNDLFTASNASSDWKFLHDATGSTVNAVVKFGNVANPNVVYALVGTNASTSANVGSLIYYDDRASIPRNNRFGVFITRGVGGSVVVDNTSADNYIAANTPHIISVVNDPSNATAANRSFFYNNSGAAVNNNVNTNAVSTANPTFNLQVGASGSGTLPLVGYIAELCIFNRILSDADRLRVEGYLAWKWGLRSSLSATNPYINQPPLIGN